MIYFQGERAECVGRIVTSLYRKVRGADRVVNLALNLARLRTYPQHTRAWLPLLRSRPGGVHRRYVVRSPKSDNLSKTFPIARFPVVNWFRRFLRERPETILVESRQAQIGNRRLAFGNN